MGLRELDKLRKIGGIRKQRFQAFLCAPDLDHIFGDLGQLRKHLEAEISDVELFFEIRVVIARKVLRKKRWPMWVN